MPCRKAFTLPFVLLLAAYSPLAAWGPAGHRAVGQIAAALLSEPARRAALELLEGQSLAEASVWADEIRSDAAWSHTGPWHYVNIEDGETYETSRQNPGGDVIQAIRRFERVLRDRTAPKQDRAVALRLLVHFVGDIHQPLHAGRAGDRGGNSISVRWFGRDSNLHAVWDSGIVEWRQPDHAKLAGQAVAAYSVRLRGWQRDGLLVWVEESMALRPQVYAIGDGNLGPRYLERNWPVVQQRIAQAGARLAALLDSVLP